MRRSFLACAALACAACVAPVQNGGVAMFPGVAERVGMICRWRHGDVASDTMCVPPDERVAPARVRVIAKDDDRLAGPVATGAPGDFVIENEEVAFVVGKIGRGGGPSEEGGTLVDAADAKARRDELAEVAPSIGGRVAAYSSIATGVDPDGAAWVEARGRAPDAPSIEVVTRYTLARDTRALLVTTTLTNRGSTTTAPLDLGDVVHWGAVTKIAPGREPGFIGGYDGKLLAGVGRDTGYALVPDGAALTSTSGATHTRTTYAAKVALKPGEKATYARSLIVAPRGDGLAVATELDYASGGSPGGFDLEIVDERGARVDPPPGARVDVRPSLGGASSIPLWFAPAGSASSIVLATPAAPRPRNAGPLGAEIAPGRYALSYSGGGRRSLGDAEIDVTAGHVAHARLVVSDARALVVDVTSDGGFTKTPAKVRVLDAQGKAVSDPLYALGGHADLALAPGRYKVVATRGPEFEIASSDVDLSSAGQRVELTIRRVVDTRGFVSCDLHQHSSKGGASAVSSAERLAASVAEGLDCVVATETNRVVDPAPVVRALGVDAIFRAFAGEEVVTDTSAKPLGHVAVFPLAPDVTDPRGGALASRDVTAKALFEAARQRPGERVVAPLHPRSGAAGFLDRAAFDPKSPSFQADFDARFDALEIWDAQGAGERPRVLDDLFALLASSRPVTPIAGSGTSTLVGGEPGYPRTYVAVADDDPAKLDAATLVEGIRTKRDVVITNGPFVTMRAGDVEQGGILSLIKPVDLVVRVQRPRWLSAGRLTLWVGGVASKPIALAPVEGADGALVDEVRIHVQRSKGGKKAETDKTGKTASLEVSADTFVVAVVTGDRPLADVLPEGQDPAAALPFAMTSPLWIDADGDGRSLAR